MDQQSQPPKKPHKLKESNKVYQYRILNGSELKPKDGPSESWFNAFNRLGSEGWKYKEQLTQTSWLFEKEFIYE